MSDSATGTDAGTTQDTPTTSATPTEPQTVEALPQWAQDQIKGLRSEAANHRIKAQSAADEAKQAADTEYTAKLADLNTQLETSKTEGQAAKLEYQRLRAVLDAGVPGEHAADVADRVRGTSEDEIRGDAKRLKDLMNLSAPQNPGAVDPTQGRGTGDALPLNGDPLMQALATKLGI